MIRIFKLHVENFNLKSSYTFVFKYGCFPPQQCFAAVVDTLAFFFWLGNVRSRGCG